jgi:hypothetical protein
VEEASVTRDISAPGTGCSRIAEDERDFLAAEKAADISADQSSRWSPRGPPRRARVSGKTSLAAAGMNFR